MINLLLVLGCFDVSKSNSIICYYFILFPAYFIRFIINTAVIIKCLCN